METLTEKLEAEVVANTGTTVTKEATLSHGGEMFDYFSQLGGTQSGGTESKKQGVIISLDKKSKAFVGGSTYYKKITRTDVSRKIVNELQWLSENHEEGEPTGSPKIQSICKYIGEHLDELKSYDAFDSFLISLRIGLLEELMWIDLSGSDFSKIGEIIIGLNNSRNLNHEQADKYIAQLYDLGLSVF